MSHRALRFLDLFQFLVSNLGKILSNQAEVKSLGSVYFCNTDDCWICDRVFITHNPCNSVSLAGTQCQPMTSAMLNTCLTSNLRVSQQTKGLWDNTLLYIRVAFQEKIWK